MAYDRSYWKDHVTDQSGEVIQQGTLLDQQHFNNMEAWRSGAPENMYGIRGPFLVLGRDGEALCDVIDPREVCRMLGGRKAEAYGQPGGA